MTEKGNRKVKCHFSFSFFLLLFKIEVHLVYSVVNVFRCTAVIQLYFYISILFQILFPCRLLQNIKYSSLYYTVGPCWLSVIYSSVYMLIPSS